MKYRCIIILMLLCSSVYAQSILSDKVDEFSKKRNIQTKPYEGKVWKKSDFIDHKNQVLVSMIFSTGDDVDLWIMSFSMLTTADFGCLSEYNGKVIFLFDNDSTMEAYQVSNTDCSNSDGYSASYAMVSREELKNGATLPTLLTENLEKLRRNAIKKIRVYGSKGYIDFTIKPEKRGVLTTHINLIKGKLGQ